MKQVKTLMPLVVYTKKAEKKHPKVQGRPSGNGVATFWQSHVYHG